MRTVIRIYEAYVSMGDEAGLQQQLGKFLRVIGGSWLAITSPEERARYTEGNGFLLSNLATFAEISKTGHRVQ